MLIGEKPMKDYHKGSPDDPEMWLAYQISGGLMGYPPPKDWNPQPVQLDDENENWLHGSMKENPWGGDSSLSGEGKKVGLRNLIKRIKGK